MVGGKRHRGGGRSMWEEEGGGGRGLKGKRETLWKQVDRQHIYIISSILRHVSPVINFQQWMWCKCNA